MAAQAELGQQQPGGGPLTMTGGRRGMGGSSRPGGFGPVVGGVILPHHPFDPEAPISKSKPLIVGSNRDETIFFFQQQRNTEVFNLTDATLKERIDREFGDKADAMLAAYRKSRPEASPTDLYIAITTPRLIGIGAITIAERKYAQHGSPVYMYIFTHESNNLVPGAGDCNAADLSRRRRPGNHS
jgi:para-nitrobenzyl esterase